MPNSQSLGRPSSTILGGPWRPRTPPGAIYGHYESFEQCQKASIGALRQLTLQHQSEDFGSYECGVGCRDEKEWDMYVCKETRKQG